MAATTELQARSRSEQMRESEPGSHRQAQGHRSIGQRNAQIRKSPGRQVIIIQTIAAIITTKPVIAVATKACSTRSIAITAPFSSASSFQQS
ncbi:hypothetical protein [Bradyrhizobium sp. CCGB01]|uniref:hypothetical protein n=1 Tax=Bradyrhizobium sp. CCGB01 TaxID=2949634 RepID=UPI0020B1C56B|nr:hypothetical protein [Bradyrhizobium sp. CCGB01]MCP3410218.1 hypothetical protein [Bradyrhizobium sp. CCGB01]